MIKEGHTALFVPEVDIEAKFQKRLRKEQECDLVSLKTGALLPFPLPPSGIHPKEIRAGTQRDPCA